MAWCKRKKGYLFDDKQKENVQVLRKTIYIHNKKDKRPSQAYPPFPKKSKKKKNWKKTSIYKGVLKTPSAQLWKYKIMAAITQASSLSLL